jgi:penicillin-insensitive murein endopeptidase
VREGARTWGLPVLVQTLRRAAGRVAKKHGRSVLLVGDLSARKGGALDGHNSHQTGRDADIGFYATNSKGMPVPQKRFIEFDGAGKAEVPSWLRFDDERNWALVEALLEDKDGGVRYLFVSGAVRGRLLAYAVKKKVPKDLIARATAAMLSPRDEDGHDDHFHVRIACPEAMRGVCMEEPSAQGLREAAEPAADSGAVAPAAAEKAVAPAAAEKAVAPAAAEKAVAGGGEVR